MFEPSATLASPAVAGVIRAGSGLAWVAPSDASGTAAEAVADLLAAARRLARTVVADRGPSARRGVLSGLGQVEGILAGVRSVVLLAERDAGSWQRPGVPSFEAAHGTASRGGLPAARRDLRQAEVIATMPTIAGAVDSGVMPVGHLDAFARIASGSTDVVGAALATAAVQDAVVAMAAAQDAPTFTRSLARMVAELDPASRELAHENQRARRFLHLSDQPDGTHITGLLDRIAGHRLRLALESTGERPGPVTAQGHDAGAGVVLDERTSEQARADALDAVARRILSLPQTASGASVPPQISLLMTEQTLAALRTGARSRAASRGTPVPLPASPPSDTPITWPAHAPAHVPATTLPDGTPVPAVTLEDGTPVPTSEVVKALCDCQITRIVVDAAGTPVDLGRSARLYTGTQRRGVIARDRQCTFPGCDRHARWGEVHHIAWWDRDNGRTSLDNAVLLCSYHHHQVHRHDLSIERHPPHPARTRPPGTPSTADRFGPEPPGATYTFRDPRGRVVSAPRRGGPRGGGALEVDASGGGA